MNIKDAVLMSTKSWDKVKELLLSAVINVSPQQEPGSSDSSQQPPESTNASAKVDGILDRLNISSAERTQIGLHW